MNSVGKKIETRKEAPEIKEAGLEVRQESSFENEIEKVGVEKLKQKTQVNIESTVGEPGVDTQRTPLHQEIENILEADLEDIYFKMDQDTQEIFKKKGEEATQQIMKLIKETKITFGKVFKLIFGWLKIIPGANKFFLEQEAKIKADKIMKITPNI